MGPVGGRHYSYTFHRSIGLKSGRTRAESIFMISRPSSLMRSASTFNGCFSSTCIEDLCIASSSLIFAIDDQRIKVTVASGPLPALSLTHFGPGPSPM